jgi:glucosamine-6-phosphate deaminase
LLRRNEARAALRIVGVSGSNIRFLDLPFYENGRYRNFRPTEHDTAAVQTLLREFQPHQIFTTGADQDPSSVAGVSFEVMRKAWNAAKDEAWRRDCRVWLYRSPEKTWETHEIDMAVPMSPDQLDQKLQAIYQHKTQRSQTPLRANGAAESWSEAEHAARSLAQTYDALGLAEYEAIEAFARWREN